MLVSNLKMHLHNITCNFISRHITLLSRAFAREHYYKLFRKSFAASILAFAEPSHINSLTTQYMSGFRRCSYRHPVEYLLKKDVWGSPKQGAFGSIGVPNSQVDPGSRGGVNPGCHREPPFRRKSHHPTAPEKTHMRRRSF